MAKRKIWIYSLWLLAIIVLYTCTGCSAQWHLRTALRKDPSISDSDTVTRLVPMNIPSITTSFDCSKLMKPAKIELYSLVTITNPVTKRTYIDTVFVNLHTSDSTGQVTATVDCPDVEVAIQTINNRTYIKPTLIDMWPIFILGLLVGAISFFVASKK